MAAFKTLDWRNLDVFAILVGSGVATLESSFADRSLEWLRSKLYTIKTLDFAHGIGPVVVELGQTFHWEQQFGYQLQASDRNLARLRDGLWYEIPERSVGLVLEVLDFEKALTENREWSEGFLGVLSEHSKRQLALGRRFFAVVHVADSDSPIIGLSLGEKSVPHPCPFPQRERDV